MKAQRRTFLKWLAVPLALPLFPRKVLARSDDIRHILPTVTDTAMSVSVSVDKPRVGLWLDVDGDRVAGTKKDSKGRFWSFRIDGLKASRAYELQLIDENGRLGESWPLKTFPDRDAEPDKFRLLAYTCAGGGDGTGLGSRQFFKPHSFRQNLFEAALQEKPDAAIAIGDHIYWDLRGQEHPVVGRNSRWLKYLSGWYFSLRYGSFDRAQPIIGTANEVVLVRIGDEQIADLYGTRFKSTPIYFLPDDHDYFENDDAEPYLVTLPPDKFSRKAHRATAELYYPELPGSPGPQWNRAFGSLTYGRLFEAALFDCAGHITVGEEAKLIPDVAEQWLNSRTSHSTAKHFAMVPSHPLGWTAGKWREWYPDVVAPEGFTGVVTNELFAGAQGRLTTAAQKYHWQEGWWHQHQRLLETMSRREGSRMIFSGDIHAQGAVDIRKSGQSVLTGAVKSFLVGPVSTSDATWPSAARGIAAGKPEWLETEDLLAAREVNGFTLFEFDRFSARARIFDCGGYDRSKGEDGRVQGVEELAI